MKLRVTGTRNQCEKVGLVSGTYPYDFSMGVPPREPTHDFPGPMGIKIVAGRVDFGF